MEELCVPPGTTWLTVTGHKIRAAPFPNCYCGVCVDARLQNIINRGGGVMRNRVDTVAGTDAVEATLQQRGNKYGDVKVQATMFKELMVPILEVRHSLGAVEFQSLTMIALKMSRIICGDQKDADTWKDIEGYARLPFRDHTDPEG
jgi:hypothetical protein